jgi:hypothetical protein
MLIPIVVKQYPTDVSNSKRIPWELYNLALTFDQQLFTINLRFYTVCHVAVTTRRNIMIALPTYFKNKYSHEKDFYDGIASNVMCRHLTGTKYFW